MDANELRRRFPQASAGFIAANLSAADPGAVAVVERDRARPAVVSRPAQERDPRQFLVRVTSVRRRLLDEDNLCEKYHVDCCRYAGVLPDDSPRQVHIETTQRKVAKGEEEHTEIEVFEMIPEQEVSTRRLPFDRLRAGSDSKG